MIIARIKNSQQGSLLLLSLLILSGLLVSGSTIGVITVQHLRQGKAVDYGLVAYYAAESGVEDGLYELRRKGTAVGSLATSGSLANGASWARPTPATTVANLTRSIKQNEVWEINLYNPESSVAPLPAPIRSLRLSWPDTGSDLEWLEVQVVPWSIAAITSSGWSPSPPLTEPPPAPPAQPAALQAATPATRLFSAASNPATVNLVDAANVLYRVRIKALYADVPNLTVIAFRSLNLGGGAAPIPAQITMTATGSFKESKQAVRASMPQRAPLSGAFGYVLFTEEDLIKQ